MSDRIAFIDRDPGVHTIDQGDQVSVISPPLDEKSSEVDQVLHLVQDEEMIAELHQCVLPPGAILL